MKHYLFTSRRVETIQDTFYGTYNGANVSPSKATNGTKSAMGDEDKKSDGSLVKFYGKYNIKGLHIYNANEVNQNHHNHHHNYAKTATETVNQANESNEDSETIDVNMKRQDSL